MLELKKIAITGGIASGKSTVCKLFGDLGAYIVSADEIVHQLLDPNTEVGQKVIRLFGKNIVVDNKIDRNQIANQAFNNPTKLRQLEQILHPAVYSEIGKQYRKAQEKGGYSLFAVEIPLLFESGGETFFDSTVAVVSSPQEAAQRFTKSTGYEIEEYNRRMAFQLSPKDKAEKADFIINNQGTLDELKASVKEIYYQFKEN